MKLTHAFLGAKVSDGVVIWPRAVFKWLISESAPLVNASSKLLHSENPEEKEDEKHEADGVTQIWQRR